MTSVRFSHLKAIAQSPAHYRAALRGRADSLSMRIGRLVDDLLIGSRAPVVYDGERRGNAWRDFQEEHDGADIFTRSEFLRAKPMVESVLQNARAVALLSGAHQERIEWELMGRACSGTPDVAGALLVDLKTTKCAQPERFKRDATFRAYHAQLAWYRDGLARKSVPRRPEECYIVAVENVDPYPVTVLRLTERTLTEGEKLFRLWMERLLSCEAEDSWPGYVQDVVDWDIEYDVELTGFDEGDDE